MRRTDETGPDACRPSVPAPIGGGEMGRRVRETDWSGTSLGGYETWPQSLRSTLSIALNAKGIAALYWGPDHLLLYNDAYGAALGDRHPEAFGRPMAEVLDDIAPVLGPQVAESLRTGEGFAIENLPLTMRRHGRDEETVWTYGFSPVQGEDGGFAGVLLMATETTKQATVERDRDAAQVELEESNRSLRLEISDRRLERDRIWQLSGDMLGVADDQGVWLSVNPAWTRTLGWKPDEIVGRTSQWMEHPADVARTRSEIGRLAAGRTTFEFENRFLSRDGSYRTLSWTAVPEGGLLYCVARDMTDARRQEQETIVRIAANEAQAEALVDANSLIAAKEIAEERQRELQSEMAHRIKNTLSMVMAIVSQTMRHAETTEAAAATIGERINALSQAQDLLRQTTYASATIGDVVRGALKVHLEREDRVTVTGPQIELPSQAALGLSLAVHELATNAVKYGALSTAAGHVDISWRHADDGAFRFEWRERDGPAVERPTRKGFGSRLIDRIVPSYFEGTGMTEFAQGGVCYKLDGIVSIITADSQEPSAQGAVAAHEHRHER